MYCGIIVDICPHCFEVREIGYTGIVSLHLLSIKMGNGASGGPFDLGSELSSSNAIWDLNEGSRRRLNANGDEVFDKVLVFRSKKDASVMEVAKRGSQKLRVMKHPNILAFVDGSELDGSVLVAAEAAIPLPLWTKQVLGDSCRQNEEIIHEIVWGFYCIVNALQFVHRQCKLLHGGITPESIFITRMGEWKLGSLDLASDVSIDENFYAQHMHLAGQQFAPPERLSGDWRALFNSTLFGPIDVYGLGAVFKHLFDELRLDPPGQLGQYLKKMVTSEPKKRPTTAQILRCPVFGTDVYKGMQTVQELAVKTSDEAITILVGLNDGGLDLTQSVTTYKILPVILRLLNTFTEEFNNRNLRDTARKNIGVCMTCLSKFAEDGKIEEEEFHLTGLETLLGLWSISDRSVRTSLLHSLRGMSALYTPEAVNKRVFDMLLVGFSDANALMREETLKSLVHIVDKLDENLTNDKLPRCIASLQGDGEPSIRTNAVIFLGRIIPRLKQSNAVRLMCTGLLKATKDGFGPCRLAALKSLHNNFDLIDCGNLTTKVMPSVATMTLDRIADIRVLAIRVLESTVTKLRSNHDTLCIEEGKARSNNNTPIKEGGGSGTSSNTAGSVSPAGSSVFSWAVNSLSKSLEDAAEEGVAPKVTVPVPRVTSAKSSSTSTAPTPPTIAKTSRLSGLSLDKPTSQASTSWDDEDLDFDDAPSSSAAVKTLAAEVVGVNDGWGDDDLDFPDDDGGPSDMNIPRAQPTTTIQAVATARPTRLRTSSSNSAGGTPKKGMSLKAPKKVVTKLANDDDDDWDF